MVSKVTKHHLVLQDELQPQVGSGHRWVQAQVGRKWVYVRERMDTNLSASDAANGKHSSLKPLVTLNGTGVQHEFREVLSSPRAMALTR